MVALVGSTSSSRNNSRSKSKCRTVVVAERVVVVAGVVGVAKLNYGCFTQIILLRLSLSVSSILSTLLLFS